jgi:hypothetical protein
LGRRRPAGDTHRVTQRPASLLVHSPGRVARPAPMNAWIANRMTSGRIVTPGQAMATILTMTPRTPSRINEVDVDLNMTGIPFVRLGLRRAGRKELEYWLTSAVNRHIAAAF